MLNERQIELLPERIYQRISDINTEYLKSIGQTIKKIGELRPSDVHKLQQMYNYGEDIESITKKLSDASGKNVKEIYEIFDLVAEDNYKSTEIFYKAKNKTFIPYEQNEDLKQYVHNMAKQTVNEYINLTQHTAFAVFSKDGKSIAPLYLSNKEKMATSLSDTYSKIVDYAVSKVQLGMSDYNSAVKEICKAMTNSGIRTVDYATGYKRRLDTTVRQNVLHGIKKCNQNTADKIGEEFGADGYEVSYHSNPRETHADMAGKQYAKGEARTVNGVYYPSFDTVAHLLEEYNCLHFKYSIILGVSQPAYSEEQLRTFKNNDKKTFEFEGKPYTMYDASQLQRKIETAIRHQKDLSVIAKAAGSEELQQEAQLKINQLANKYDKLSKASGLPTKVERMQSTFNKKNVHNFIDKSEKSGIIVSGAISGARNPYGEKAQKHAEKYYELVRSMKTDVLKIAKTTGFSEEQIKEVKNYIFYEKHDLGGEKPELFKPDFMMSESWKRLIDGKPEAHDITLVNHEIMERDLIKKGYTQYEAHITTSKTYNYDKEATEFYDKIEKYSD